MKDLLHTFKYSQSGNCTNENGIWKKAYKDLISIMSDFIFNFLEVRVSSLTSNLLHLSPLPPSSVSSLSQLTGPLFPLTADD